MGGRSGEGCGAHATPAVHKSTATKAKQKCKSLIPKQTGVFCSKDIRLGPFLMDYEGSYAKGSFMKARLSLWQQI